VRRILPDKAARDLKEKKKRPTSWWPGVTDLLEEKKKPVTKLTHTFRPGALA
jgi:hypothetical protein